MEKALEVEKLGIRFGRTRVLEGLSFSAPSGQTLAVIGPNGAGKTVLFRALVGSLPHDGTVKWAAGTRLGYLPQKLDLDRDLPMTGADFLRAKAAVARAGPADVARALARVGLDEPLTLQPIGDLSGGQFQRLLLAFVLIGDPNVLLLDEPAAGVDEPSQERLYDLIRRLQEDSGVTVLFISHDLSVVTHYATHVLCLNRGRASFGPPRVALTPESLTALYGMPLRFHVHDDPRC